MQKTLNRSEKQNDLLKLFWVFVLLLFVAVGLAAHAANPPKNEAILLSAPNLYGKNFFTVLINSPDPKEAPKNFHLLATNTELGLQASSSAALSKGQIDFLISKLNSDATPGTLGVPKQIHVVDTSSHAHGFVNNMQVIWLEQNIQFGSEDQAIRNEERDLLLGLKKAKKLSLYTLPESLEEVSLSTDEVVKHGGKKIQVQADAVETEQQYLATKKISYTRIPMTATEVSKVEDKQIDQLAKIVSRLKKEEWLHFHNEEGTKNLSIAVLVTDVLKSASAASLEDILNRQNELNTQAKIAVAAASPKLMQIYTYAKEYAPVFKTSFSAWTKTHAPN